MITPAPGKRFAVRLHFQKEPWDLYAAVGYTVVMAAILLAFGEGNLLAILLVLFLPGYVLVATLSQVRSPEGIRRSIGLSGLPSPSD